MLKTKNTKLNRHQNGMLALEQRFMFDGAAIADALDNSVDFQVRIPSGFSHSTTVAQAEALTEQLVSQFLARTDAREQLYALFNGGQVATEPSAELKAAVDQLLEQVQQGNLHLRVELLSSAELQGANAAFAAKGTDGAPVIYLNKDVLPLFNQDKVVRLLLEETGHWLDFQINNQRDTVGDEGALFAAKVLNDTVSEYSFQNMKLEDDSALLIIEGASVRVEESAAFVDVGGAALDFSVGSGDQRISGTALAAGETWIYRNVITINSDVVDAIVRFNSITTGSDLYAFDSTSTPYSDTLGGRSPATFLQPNFTWSSTGGQASFTISFIVGGSYNASSNPTGTSITLRNVYVNSYDLDSTTSSSSGVGGNQYTSFTGVGGLDLSSNTALITNIAFSLQLIQPNDISRANALPPG